MTHFTPSETLHIEKPRCSAVHKRTPLFKHIFYEVIVNVLVHMPIFFSRRQSCGSMPRKTQKYNMLLRVVFAMSIVTRQQFVFSSKGLSSWAGGGGRGQCFCSCNLDLAKSYVLPCKIPKMYSLNVSCFYRRCQKNRRFFFFCFGLYKMLLIST